jgi:hypothetical protein
MTYSTITPHASDGGWSLVFEGKELIRVETVGGSKNHIHVQVNDVPFDYQRGGF